MKVAVLLATFNGGEYIEEQIDSILNLSDVDTTVFVSDDCSKDDTLKLLEQYSTNKVFLLPPVRSGSAGQNFFRLIRDIPRTDFDYFAFADQDDIWRSLKLVRAINILTENYAAGYSSDVEAFFPDGTTKLVKKSHPQKEWDFLFESAGPGNTIVLPKESFELIRDFIVDSDSQLIDRVTFHDWFIYAFFRSREMEWVIDTFPGVKYRQHSDNVIGASVGVTAFYSRIKRVFSGWYLEQSLLIHKILYRQPTRIEKILRPSTKSLLFNFSLITKCRRRPLEQFAFALILFCVSFVSDTKYLLRKARSLFVVSL